MHRLPGQDGQAIVIVALMITVLIGMVGIAVDGSRAYALRRDLEAAVDAAALAGADKLQQTGDYVQAEQAATTKFGVNLRLYTSPSCSPAYGSPGASPIALTCTYSDGTSLRLTVSRLGPQGSQFALTANRQLQLQFAAILTNGVAPTVAATATSSVSNLRYAPAISALDQAGCGGTAGADLTITGGGTLEVIGDVVTAGAVSVTAGGLLVGGDVYARCQPSVAGVTSACYPSGASTPCTYPDVAGATRTGFHLVDPNYPPPGVVGGSQAAPGNNVSLFAGLYAADPGFSTSRCYFLTAGVYEWQGGYTNAGGFVSNELKPPDEPAYNNNTALAHQMWDVGGVNCAGSFQLNAVTGSAIREGTWAVEVTATRTETFNGINYKRESAPSMCRLVTVTDTLSVIKVTVSNVPGATGYNVYAAPPSNGCNGPFGFAGGIPVTGTMRNDGTAGCPAFSGTTCSLGYVSAVFDATLLGLTFAPNANAAADTPGAYPPSGETAPLRNNLPDQNPDRANPPAGDRANENQCSTTVGAAISCPGPITPGAVEFYVPSTGCLNATTSGDNFLFSGYQYDWILVYEPGNANPPANGCANMLGAAADSAWVGFIYMPVASLTVSKAATFRTEATGGIMADTIAFTGQLPEIIYSANYAPAQPAARLIN